MHDKIESINQTSQDICDRQSAVLAKIVADTCAYLNFIASHGETNWVTLTENVVLQSNPKLGFAPEYESNAFKGFNFGCANLQHGKVASLRYRNETKACLGYFDEIVKVCLHIRTYTELIAQKVESRQAAQQKQLSELEGLESLVIGGTNIHQCKNVRSTQG